MTFIDFIFYWGNLKFEDNHSSQCITKTFLTCVTAGHRMVLDTPPPPPPEFLFQSYSLSHGRTGITVWLIGYQLCICLLMLSWASACLISSALCVLLNKADLLSEFFCFKLQPPKKQENLLFYVYPSKESVMIIEL